MSRIKSYVTNPKLLTIDEKAKETYLERKTLLTRQVAQSDRNMPFITK
jgi:hypothetical protein